jgi:glucan biosynthesis protein C
VQELSRRRANLHLEKIDMNSLIGADAAPLSSLSKRMDVPNTAKRLTAPSERLHYLDAFRVLMLLLGIPFHAADVFRVNSEWLIAAPVGSPMLVYFIQVVHSFRMFAFFLVSGYLSALILSRKPVGQWLRSRLVRLGVPLLMATLLLGLAEKAIVAVHVYRSAPLDATYEEVLESAILTGTAGSWIFHRWFLVNLLIYTIVFAAAVRLKWIRLAPIGVPPCLAGLLNRPVIVHALVIALLAFYGLADAAPFQFVPREIADGALRLDWLLAHAAPFTVGIVLALTPTLYDLLTANLARAAGWAAMCLLIYLFVVESSKGIEQYIFRLSILPCGFSCSIFFLAACRRLLGSEMPMIRLLTDGAFTIYLVHVTFILIFCQPLIAAGIPPFLSAVATAVLSASASATFFLLIRRVPSAGWIFNGAPFPRSARDSIARKSGQTAR